MADFVGSVVLNLVDVSMVYGEPPAGLAPFCNWTGKLEGLYMDYGSVSGSPVLTTSNIPLGFDYTPKVTDVVLRVGVNYHFGNSIVAKY